MQELTCSYHGTPLTVLFHTDRYCTLCEPCKKSVEVKVTGIRLFPAGPVNLPIDEYTYWKFEDEDKWKKLSDEGKRYINTVGMSAPIELKRVS